jgi:hypothetical protein
MTILPNDLPRSLAAAVGLAGLSEQLETLAGIADEEARLKFAMLEIGGQVTALPQLLAQCRPDRRCEENGVRQLAPQP